MKELLQQALDALMLDHSEGLTVQEGKFLDSTAASIRAALAEQEPVAWITRESKWRLTGGGNSIGTVPVHAKQSNIASIPIYTTPPQRQWVGLTDEERENFKGLGLIGIELVEAKLREKNK